MKHARSSVLGSAKSKPMNVYLEASFTLRISISKMSADPPGIFLPEPRSPSEGRRGARASGQGAGRGPARQDAAAAAPCAAALCGRGALRAQASSEGMNSCHLSPCRISCIASVQPAMTWLGAKVAGWPRL
eukprot:869368-Prymnesium_polylepis.1